MEDCFPPLSAMHKRVLPTLPHKKGSVGGHKCPLSPSPGPQRVVGFFFFFFAFFFFDHPLIGPESCKRLWWRDLASTFHLLSPPLYPEQAQSLPKCWPSRRSKPGPSGRRSWTNSH